MKIGKIIGSAVLATLLMGSFTGCSDDNDDDDKGSSDPVGRAAINSNNKSQDHINNVANNVIKLTYEKLEEGATGLKTALSDFNSTVDANDVTTARAAWRVPRAYWEASEAYIVATAPSVGSATDGNTDSWPVSSEADIAEGLSNWNGDSLTILTADGEIKGFHTIEYYLFGDGNAVETPADAAARLNASVNQEGKYLKALGSAFEHDMLGLTTIWTSTEEDAATALDAFTGLNKADAAANLIQGCVDIATEVGDGKIADPLGDGSPSTTDTTKVESQFSWNSSSDFYNNIHSIKKVWDGGLKNLAIIAKVSDAKRTKVDDSLTEALTALKKISNLNDIGKVKNGTYIISQDMAFRNKLVTTEGITLIKTAQSKVKLLTIALEAVQADMAK